jgi:PIN domain
VALSVIPDTNSLQSEGWSLDSDPLRVVMHECKRGAFALCVPEVVVRELTAHGADRALEAAKQYTRSADALWRLGELESRPEPISLHATYPGKLRATLETFGATILPVPQIAHADLLDRAVGDRKPFRREKGTGYKDALIWYSLLELLREKGPPVAFVTADGDFRDGDDLAEDLIKDLQDAGYPADSVRLYKSFSDLVGEEVADLRELQAQFELRIQHDAGFRAYLIANLIVAADEEGSWVLESLLPNVPLLDVQGAQVNSFMPKGDPVVLNAVRAKDHETYEVALRGTLDIVFDVEPAQPLPIPTKVSVTDHVDVEYVFQVAYRPDTELIGEARLLSVMAVSPGVVVNMPRQGRITLGLSREP